MPILHKLLVRSTPPHLPMPHIQRHFRPLTLRARFSPERLLTPPPSTLRTTFSVLEAPSDAAKSPTTDIGRVSPLLIKKPVGEVYKNYKLWIAASLDPATYRDIDVQSFTFLCSPF
jgi:hypothetical protein